MRNAPTIRDVAEALGMHKSTVSLALSGTGTISASTRARVRAAARELGYEPNPLAQRLANGQSKTLVCLVSGMLDVGLATEKVLLIQKELMVRALEVPLYTFGEPGARHGRSQAAQIKQLCRQRPRAIVCATSMLDPDVFQELAAYRQAGGIVVSYDVPIPLECDQVIFDREDNSYQAARYLLERGHRRLGLSLTNTAEWLSEEASRASVSQELRGRGFRRALAEFGLEVREEWLFQTPAYEKGGARMAAQFLALPERPTGLCIANDRVALAFQVEAARAGVRIPADVSLVGLDNEPTASYCPVPLTSASQPPARIARAVVDLLRARLDGSDIPPQTVTICGDLVERDSVASFPAKSSGKVVNIPSS